MRHLPLIYGYAGALPFLAFMAVPFFVNNPDLANAARSLHLIYGAMIASFLAGPLWLEGLRRGDKLRPSIAMLPTILSLLLILTAAFFNISIPLILMAVLFWGLYFADHALLPLSELPHGYMRFRLTLSIIVSASFICAGLYLLSTSGL